MKDGIPGKPEGEQRSAQKDAKALPLSTSEHKVKIP